jgi:hypothetical protein
VHAAIVNRHRDCALALGGHAVLDSAFHAADSARALTEACQTCDVAEVERLMALGVAPGDSGGGGIGADAEGRQPLHVVCAAAAQYTALGPVPPRRPHQPHQGPGQSQGQSQNQGQSQGQSQNHSYQGSNQQQGHSYQGSNQQQGHSYQGSNQQQGQSYQGSNQQQRKSDGVVVLGAGDEDGTAGTPMPEVRGKTSFFFHFLLSFLLFLSLEIFDQL